MGVFRFGPCRGLQIQVDIDPVLGVALVHGSLAVYLERAVAFVTVLLAIAAAFLAVIISAMHVHAVLLAGAGIGAR